MNLSQFVDCYFSDYLDVNGLTYLWAHDNENPYGGKYNLFEIQGEDGSISAYCHYELIDKPLAIINFYSYASSVSFSLSDLVFKVELRGDLGLGRTISFYYEEKLVGKILVRCCYPLNEDKTEYYNLFDEIEYNGKKGVDGFIDCVLTFVEVKQSIAE